MSPPITPRKITAWVLTAALGAAVAVTFISMITPAAAREVQAACKGLRPTMRNPALGELPRVAPDFEVIAHDGRKVKLSDFRGKVVLVNFWASWCNVCKSEKPSLKAFTEELAGDDLEVITIASDRDWKAIQEVLPDGAPFEVYLDPPIGDDNLGPVTQAWGIKAVPETFVIDRTGKIQHYLVNKRDWMSGVAATCVQSLIDDR